MVQVKSSQSIQATKRRYKIWLFIAIIFTVWAGYTLLNQIDQKSSINEKLISLEAERDTLNIELEKLQNQVELLNDPEYISQLATKEQGMVKEGEQQIFSE